MSTIFAKIISGEIPSNKVYEDEHTFAFLDADPINPGHTLVIPKDEYKNIYEISEEAFLQVMKTVHKLSPIIKEAVGADGINIGQNNESAAGQEVFHLHVHIMPRFEDDNFTHWQGAKNYHEGEKGTEIATKISKNL